MSVDSKKQELVKLMRNHDFTKNQQSKSVDEIKSYDIEQHKVDHLYVSFNDFIKTLSRELKRKKAIDTLSDDSSFEMSGKKVTIKSEDLYNRLCELADFAKGEDVLYYQDYDTKSMKSDIKSFVYDVVTALRKDIYKISFQSQSSVVEDVTKNLRHDKTFRKLKEQPKSMLITTNQHVLDLEKNKKLEFYDVLFEYDILRTNPNHYLIYDELDSKHKTLFKLHQHQIARIFNDWSNGDNEKLRFLKQVCYAVIQGWGRDKFIVLKGEGGNGKSSFLNILKKLAGKNQYCVINAHQWSDDNSLNKLNESTHVIVGDDAEKNQSMSATGVANMKSITSGQEINVKVKYDNNKTIKTNALYVQATNSDLQFFENNNAMLRRLIVYLWDAAPYDRELSEDVFDLESLIENQFFIDVLFTTILDDVQYFNMFDIPDESIQAAKDMLNEGDSVSTFMSDILDTIQYYENVPMKLLFLSYHEWRKRNNPDGGRFKYQSFVKAVNDYCRMNDIEVESRRLKYHTYRYRTSLMNYLKIDDTASLSERQAAIVFNDTITDDELNHFANNLDDYLNIELTDRQQQIVRMIVEDLKMMHVASSFEKYL